MDEAPKLYQVSSGKVSLNLHPGQLQAWNSKARFVLIQAGCQSGKTSLIPWLIWREAQRCGQGDYLAVTTSFDLFQLKLLPEVRVVFEDVLKIGKFWGGIGVMELAENLIPGGKFWAKTSNDNMWGRIILRSIQSEGGLESATAKAAFLDECGQDSWTVQHWEAILRRVSLYRGRVFGATTIYNAGGWLKDQWYDKWKAGDPDYEVVQFPSYANPAFPREEYERAKRTLPDWRFRMFYNGEYSKPAGAIYDCYGDQFLVDDFEPPKHWPRVCGVDFGGAHTAMLWLAQDPEKDIWYCYKEYLGGNVPTSEHCFIASAEARGCSVVPDYFGGSPGETQYRNDWWENGVDVMQPPIGDVEIGISRVYQLMRDNKFRVCRGLERLRHEFGTYRRKLGSDGQPTNAIMDAHTKHMLDSLRVAVVGLTEGAGTDIASFDDVGQ